MSSNQAPNRQAVLDWVQANRPDCWEYFCDIMEPDGPNDAHRDALLLLITIGFAAGRQYQIDHPELGAHSYHSDDSRLPRHPPVKSANQR